LQNALI